MVPRGLSAYYLVMPYYELRKLKRGGPPDSNVRPASSRDPDSGSELFEAKDDDEAAAKGEHAQTELGGDYIVSVYDNENMQRRMVYPRQSDDA
jgi:hypothetical protein